eukprot:TRINITY_DN1095_c0_g1_i1.p1 TRINITY_DN1095_c0_g1~~TRINITY_DN1095_c0_g1_i1.p1  ORF type:complete len:521 (+),score=114.00 TRINITY_DN1095_c0_g1_i1:155-1564(+)
MTAETLESISDERAMTGICGWPACDAALANNGKKKPSCFCGSACVDKVKQFRSRLQSADVQSRGMPLGDVAQLPVFAPDFATAPSQPKTVIPQHGLASIQKTITTKPIVVRKRDRSDRKPKPKVKPVQAPIPPQEVAKPTPSPVRPAVSPSPVVKTVQKSPVRTQKKEKLDDNKAKFISFVNDVPDAVLPEIEEIGQDRLMKLDNKVLNQMIDTFDKMEVQHKEKTHVMKTLPLEEALKIPSKSDQPITNMEETHNIRNEDSSSSSDDDDDYVPTNSGLLSNDPISFRSPKSGVTVTMSPFGMLHSLLDAWGGEHVRTALAQPPVKRQEHAEKVEEKVKIAEEESDKRKRVLPETDKHSDSAHKAIVHKFLDQGFVHLASQFNMPLIELFAAVSPAVKSFPSVSSVPSLSPKGWQAVALIIASSAAFMKRLSVPPSQIKKAAINCELSLAQVTALMEVLLGLSYGPPQS